MYIYIIYIDCASLLLRHMVVSRIEPTLSYPETRSIFPADKQLEVDLYSIFVKGIEIVVAIGNASHTYTNKNIVYYPIYMIKNTSKAIQIGVYEIKSNQLLSVSDEHGALILEKVGQPLIYTFATKKMITEHRMLPPSINDDNVHKKEEEIPQLNEKSSIINTTIPSLRADIFTFDASSVSTNSRSINTYVEETQQSSDKIKEQFEKPSAGNSAGWLQTIMHNNYYETHENDGKNDSLFMVIRDAFLQIGQSTTVVKLREKLAPEATQELFDEYEAQYKLSSETLLTETKRAKMLQTEYAKHENMIKSTISASEQRSLINSAKKIAALHKISLSRAKTAREMVSELKFMKGVGTLDTLRKKIQTSDYPGDAWAISTLERILNIKLIVLSSDYAKNDPNNMMQCGSVIDTVIKSRGSFTPEFYIMTECTVDMHYRLISYRNKRLFTYIELPYDIKQLIVTKCVERNSGIFTLITSFRQMTQGRLGNTKYDDIDKDIVDTLDIDVLSAVDPHVVFQFYIHSADKSAGRGTGEKIDSTARKLEFTELSPKGDFPNWRRKLDDKWLHTDMPFELDGQRWNSVEHYVQADKFKNEHPNFYITFTADSNTKMSKDVNMAISATNPKAPEKIRPASIVMDPKYTFKQEEAARSAAINAKFTQIPYFKNLLLATKNAILYQYNPGKKPEIATNLILIRKNIV